MATENEPTLADIATRLDSIDKRLTKADHRAIQDRKHSANEHKQTRAAIRDATQGINVVIGQTEDRLADRIADAETSMSEALDAHARDPLAHH